MIQRHINPNQERSYKGGLVMTGRTPSMFSETRKNIEELDRNCGDCFDANCLQKCVFCPVEAERQKMLMKTMVLARRGAQQAGNMQVS